MEKEHTEWSRNLFQSLTDGGVWGIPACGLLFQKRGAKLVLIDQMPHNPAMPITPEALRDQQKHTYQECVKHFGMAGIVVTDS